MNRSALLGLFFILVLSAPARAETALLFGPIGEAGYRRYAPEPPNDPDYAVARVRAKFSLAAGADSSLREDRIRMWENYGRLQDWLQAHPEMPFLEAVYAALRELSPLARKQLVGEGATGLGGHLSEIATFTQAFSLRDQARSRFPGVLTDRKAQLLAYLVAPLHDCLKFLGSYQAQVMPDHEVMTAELVRTRMPGRVARLGPRTETMTQADADFVAGIVGDHENIEKEAGRSGRMASPRALDRAKALFFLADTLTGSVVPQDSPEAGWRLDADQLEARFTDLYFRHIDLVKGKIFRPEWGLHTLSNLTETLQVLVRDHGLVCAGSAPGQTVSASLTQAALEAIDRALAADQVRTLEAVRGNAPGPLFTPEQRERIRRVRAQVAATD